VVARSKIHWVNTRGVPFVEGVLRRRAMRTRRLEATFALLAACGGSGSTAATPELDSGVSAPDAAPLDDATAMDADADLPKTDGAADVRTDDAGTVVSTGCGGEKGLEPGAPWPMPAHCPTRRGRTSVVGPHSFNLAWTKQISIGGARPPTVGADGTLYVPVSNPDQVAAFDSSGNVKWTFDIPDEIASSVTLGADGTLYFGTVTFRTEPHLYALTPTGTLKWKFTAGLAFIAGDERVSEVAVAPDGTLYVGSADRKVYALTPEGTVKWSFFHELSYTNEVYAAPAIAPDGTLVYGTLGAADGWIVALRPDGTLKWKFHTQASVLDSPAIGDDGTIYAGSEDNHLYALTPQGTLLWSFAAPKRVFSSPTLAADGTILFADEDGKLYALNANGTLRWTFTGQGAVRGGVVVGGDGTIYLGGEDGATYALNPDGSVLFKHVFRSDGEGAPPVLGAGGQLYMTAIVDRFPALVAILP
jgi:outer membrane protein assembly factor BamB